jgi:hypothetical protein
MKVLCFSQAFENMMRLRMNAAMILRRAISIMVGVILAGCAMAHAQGVQVQAPQFQRGGPTGSVSGTVIAADTQQPARFVQVTLISTAAGNNNGDDAVRGFGGMASARTELDGTFLATNVAPGDYYVTAWAPGYIPERSILQAEMNAGKDPGTLLAQIPVVHVSADSTSSVTTTMQRGGTISGRIVWEDGSPAAGLTVTVVSSDTNVALPAALAAIQAPGVQTSAATDDRGGFRISGLPGGNYVVMTVIQNRGIGGGFQRGPMAPIRVYGSGFFHKADAKPINVRVGDERSDLRMVIDLHGLRTVTGHATASSPGLSVESGRVSLSDASDPSLQLQGTIDANGQFTVKYVPPGTYTLQVSGASTIAASNQFGNRGGQRGQSSTPGVTFQPFSQTVQVGDTDLSGVALTLTAAQ